MKRPAAAIVPLAALLVLPLACSHPSAPTAPAAASDATADALAAVEPNSMLADIRALASDDFEGRAPGTRGEELSVAYIEKAMREAGLAPGNPDGTYTQRVPLVGGLAKTTASVTVGDQTIPLAQPADLVAAARPFSGEIKLDSSEIVFAGYGVVAPEHGWDDFKGVDVRGKVVLVLVNDPQVPDARDPSKLDPAVFRGNAMTYYGRYTYKWEACAAHGAAACLVIHDTKNAGYPWKVVEASFARENFAIDEPSAESPMIAGWIQGDVAAKIARAAGRDLEELKKLALSRDFKPMALGARAALDVQTTTRKVESRNVVGKIEGADPKRRDEAVVYTAHWDHLGRDTTLAGDQIFNGAVDNASGVAALLSIARGYGHLRARPARTIVFLAVTAEEKGLLGTKYYVDHPLYPLNKTLCDLNMDSMNVLGRAKTVVSVGLGQTTLDALVQDEARAQGRVVDGDPRPEAGGFFRSDHFEFVKKGVPSMSAGSGGDIVGKPEGWGKKAREEYVAKRYHKPADEVDASWDLSGAVDDARLLLRVGWRVANGDEWPAWQPGSEFKAARDRMLRP